MTKPIEDSANASAIRTALDVPTNAALTAVSQAAAAKMDATLPALQAVFDGGTAAQKATFQSSVSGGVQLTTAAAIADAGPRAHLTPGRITDGDEAGAPVVWWSPSGSSGFWGYSISPTDKFGV